MKPLKKILVATDFSEQSAFAISRAADIAKANKAELFILHVMQKGFLDKFIDGAFPEAKTILLSRKEYAEQMLAQQIAKLKRHTLKIKKITLTAQYPAKTILHFAKKYHVDLLVMGAHGKYSIRDSFVGTTADYVAEKTRCPVLIVKNKPKHHYKKILIPVDFSKASQKAVEFATQLLPKSNFLILHVGDRAYEELLDKEDNLSYEKIDKLRKDITLLLKHKAKQFLNTCKSKSKHLPLTIKLGYPGIVILNEAQKSNRDLVIMGTAGHSKKHYLWLGRVANRVLIEIEKDIILVPPTAI